MQKPKQPQEPCCGGRQSLCESAATLARRLGQREAILTVTTEITRELDLTVLLRLIITRAVELIGAVSGAIHLWDESQQMLIPQATHGPAWVGFAQPLQQVRIALGEGVAGKVAQLRQGLVVDAYQQVPQPHPLFAEHLQGAAVLAEPLLYRDRLLGVIALSNEGTGQPFTEQDRELLSLFATQCAIAIENARLHVTTRRRAQQLDTLNHLTRTFVIKLDPDQVARETLKAAELLMPDIAGRLWEWVEDEETLHLLASIGLHHLEDSPTHTFRPHEGLTGRAIATRQPVISENLPHDPRVIQTKNWAAAEGYVSGLFLPLLHADQVYGVLTICTRQPHHFSDEEVEVLQSLAAQAAIALNNARLYKETERQRHEAEVLTDLAKEINACLDLNTILPRVVAAARKLCRSDVASIALRDAGMEAAVMRYRAGGHEQHFTPFVVAPGKGMGGQVLLSGQPLRTACYGDDPRFSHDYLQYNQDQGFVAVMVVPIRIDERIEGLLYVNNRRPHPFTDQDEAILLQLAAQAAVALRNVRLFELERQRHQQLQTIMEMNREIAGELDLERLLPLLVRQATELLGGSGGVLFRYNDIPQLLMVHAMYHSPIPLGTQFKLGQGVTGTVAAQRRGLMVNDYQTSPYRNPHQMEPDLKAVIAQPLLSAGRLLGVITVVRLHSTMPFTAEGSGIAWHVCWSGHHCPGKRQAL